MEYQSTVINENRPFPSAKDQTTETQDPPFISPSVHTPSPTQDHVSPDMDDEILFLEEIPSCSGQTTGTNQLPTSRPYRKATVVNVSGDGNCFFRSHFYSCLSYYLSITIF